MHRYVMYSIFRCPLCTGSVYLHDCPLERYIPIYLIVAGCFGVIKNISSVVQRCKNRKEERDEENAKSNPFDGIVSCFLLAWFIAGRDIRLTAGLLLWLGGLTSRCFCSS